MNWETLNRIKRVLILMLIIIISSWAFFGILVGINNLLMVKKIEQYKKENPICYEAILTIERFATSTDGRQRKIDALNCPPII